MPVALKPEIFTRHLSEIEKAASNLWRVNGCDKFNPDKALNRCHIACIMSEVGEGEKLSSPNCWNRVTCVHIIKNKNVKLFVRDCPVLRFVRVKFFFFLVSARWSLSFVQIFSSKWTPENSCSLSWDENKTRKDLNSAITFALPVKLLNFKSFWFRRQRNIVFTAKINILKWKMHFQNWIKICLFLKQFIYFSLAQQNL